MRALWRFSITFNDKGFFSQITVNFVKGVPKRFRAHATTDWRRCGRVIITMTGPDGIIPGVRQNQLDEVIPRLVDIYRLCIILWHVSHIWRTIRLIFKIPESPGRILNQLIFLAEIEIQRNC